MSFNGKWKVKGGMGMNRKIIPIWALYPLTVAICFGFAAMHGFSPEANVATGAGTFFGFGSATAIVFS